MAYINIYYYHSWKIPEQVKNIFPERDSPTGATINLRPEARFARPGRGSKCRSLVTFEPIADVQNRFTGSHQGAAMTGFQRK